MLHCLFLLKTPTPDFFLLCGRCSRGGRGGTLTVRGRAGEHTISTDLLSLGMVADAGIFVDNNLAYVVTAGRTDEGEVEDGVKNRGQRRMGLKRQS